MNSNLPFGLPLHPGDRFILRESGRGETLGGGEILDIDPLVAAAKAQPDRSVARVIAERGRVDIDQLFRLTGEKRAADVGHWGMTPAADVRAPARTVSRPLGCLGSH